MTDSFSSQANAIAGPLARYQQDLTRSGFSFDPAQQQAVIALQQLYLQLEQSWANPPSALSLWWQKLRAKPKTPLTGLYFWGGVGRGKTYMMDSFFDSLSSPRKLRMHFHRFMHRVHHELKLLKEQQDPLLKVADVLAAEADVLCFDEFFVSDIADAMILAGLLAALFERGVCLVATSNIEPDGLYRNGLQRQRFLPAIALIKQHTQILQVDSGVDYRLRTLEQAEIYHYPLDAAADQSLRQTFGQLASQPVFELTELEINDRLIPCVRQGGGCAWFDFAALCQTARSQADYIELSRLYHSVLLAKVPQITSSHEDAARRFISLVDEFYERHVKLIISAAVPMEELYAGERLVFEFQRTLSRLREMQSHEYLEREHLP